MSCAVSNKQGTSMFIVDWRQPAIPFIKRQLKLGCNTPKSVSKTVTDLVDFSQF